MAKILKEGKIIKQKPYGHFIKVYISIQDLEKLKLDEDGKVRISIENN
jgi:hypothetical protein